MTELTDHSEEVLQPESEPTPALEQEHENDRETADARGLFMLEGPPKLKAPRFKCFDSNLGRLHYFIADRSDYYAVNTYQYLDYYGFLHLLLKEQGYERVVIVSHRSETRGENFPVIAYDSISELTFSEDFLPKYVEYCNTHPDISNPAFIDEYCRAKEAALNKSTPDIRAGMGGKKTPGREKAAPVARFGRRVIRTVVPVAPASHENDKKRISLKAFSEYLVVPALEQKVIKTAIVMPLEMLQRSDYLDALLSSNLRDQVANVGDNILIITSDQETALIQLFENLESKEYRQIEKGIFDAIAQLERHETPMSHSDAIIKELSKDRRILIAASSPGMDEIANLLFSRKMSQPDRFDRLQYSKVYSLAELISSRCNSTENTKKALPNTDNNTWYVGRLADLENALGDADVLDALLDKAESLWDRTISSCLNLKATQIERIYAGPVISENDKVTPVPLLRANISEAERAYENKTAMAKLDSLTGLGPVKKQLRKLLAAAANPDAFINKPGPGHYVFSGNPGTGKTTVARLVGDILHSEGLLRKGHVVEIKQADIVAEHIGGTQAKALAKFEEALDGVLFFDEAYELVNTDANSPDVFKSSFHQEAYTLLLKFMEDNRQRVCVICAGYRDKMEKFLDANPGMRDRFSAVIDFPDYNADELYEILGKTLGEMTKLRPTEGYLEESRKVMEDMAKNASIGLEQFSNARSVRLLVEESIRNATYRDNKTSDLLPEDIPEKYKPINVSSPEMIALQKKAWDRLDTLIGLGVIKEKLKGLIRYSARAAGKDRTPGHFAFVGNPGTGKTEVARLMADILYSNGLLRTNHIVEVKAGDIIGQYTGQSAPLAEAKCKEALDGVLFIDEAYSMVDTSDNAIDGPYSSSFAKESYETILKFMEDYRQRICVIFAGYKKEMNKFLRANPGMIGRVTSENIIEFRDFSDDELIQILELMAEASKDFHVVLTDEFKDAVRSILPELRQEEGFANARSIREDVLSYCKKKALSRIPFSERVILDDGVEQLTLIPGDLPERLLPRSIDKGSEKTEVPEAEKAWYKLDTLIGLGEIKEQLKELIEYSARAAGKDRTPGHFAFVGNPGTGKTEVARLMADILYDNGLLRTNHIVEVKAGDIIGQYTGQSAPLAEAKCKEALDGVLFIDEAYSMVDTSDNAIGGPYSSSFAKESYETILKFMEDYRQRICVIFAGYKKEMNMFLDANPGMRGRVTSENIIEFRDFSDDELIQILELMAEASKDFHVVLADEFKDAVRSILPKLRREKGFANARSIRTVLFSCKKKALSRIPRSQRVVLDDGVEQLILEPGDLPKRLQLRSIDKESEKPEGGTTENAPSAGLEPFYLSKELLLNLPNPFDGKDIQGFMDHCKQVTLRVVANGSYGTAFIITPDGYALTCAHVVMGEQLNSLAEHGTGEYLTYGEEESLYYKIPFDVIAVREEFDLALIKFQTDLELPYLKVAPEGTCISDAARGHLYGFPDGHPGIRYSEWTIASEEMPRSSGVFDTIRNLSVRAFPGDSGGPIVSDETGEAIGVLQGAQKYSNGDTMIVMKPISNSDFWKQFTN